MTNVFEELKMAIIALDADFDENEHPRGKGGKFVKKGAEGYEHPSQVAKKATQLTVKTGGSTTNVKTGQSPTKGFMVSTQQDRNHQVKIGDIKNNPKELKKVLNKELRTYIMKNYDLLKKDPDKYHLGTWYDTDNDVVHYDISEVFEDMEEARKRATETGERAFFDLENFEEVETNKEYKPTRDYNSLYKIFIRGEFDVE